MSESNEPLINSPDERVCPLCGQVMMPDGSGCQCLIRPCPACGTLIELEVVSTEIELIAEEVIEHGRPATGDPLNKPKPGSDAAIDAGCICAVLDNNHGRYPPYPPDGWWITEGCPIHNAE